MKFRHQLALGMALLFLGVAGAMAQEDAAARVAALEAEAESRQYAGDLAGAEAGFRSALEAGEAVWGGDSLRVAGTLVKLGNVLRLRLRIDEAADLQRRALEIRERLAPNGLEVADSLHQLFVLAYARNDLDAMVGLSRRALDILERRGAGTLAMADALNDVAYIALFRGEFHQAVEAYRRAQEILERQAPGSIQLATILSRRGRAFMLLGDPEAAEESLRQAEYRARYEEIYRDAIELELESGRPDAAFHLVERSRARSFLALLAERDLEFRELPAELARSRRDNSSRYDRALAELADWTPEAGEEAREALSRELERLRRERDEIADRIRAASPRVAELRQPQPLDLEAARKVLDPGTLAQIELIREPLRITNANGQAIEMDASAPFFWAAFQLFGDWSPVRFEPL